MRFSKHSRLTHRREFLAVKDLGGRKAGRLFVLNVLLPEKNPYFRGESPVASLTKVADDTPQLGEDLVVSAGDELARSTTRPAGTPHPTLCRLGIITTRRVGNAVRRVHMRRLVREAFRACESLLRPGVWIVVVARAELADAKLQDVQSEWLRLARALSILKAS